MAHAAHQAEINATRADGTSLRDACESVLARGPSSLGYKTAVEKLNGPEIPDALAYLWGWYLELRAALAAGMSYRDWIDLYEHTPTPFEVRVLASLDATVRKATHAPPRNEVPLA